MANGSSSAETGNEFSAHLNHLTDPLEEDPLDFDLPDLLSTEVMKLLNARWNKLQCIDDLLHIL